MYQSMPDNVDVKHSFEIQCTEKHGVNLKVNVYISECEMASEP